MTPNVCTSIAFAFYPVAFFAVAVIALGIIMQKRRAPGEKCPFPNAQIDPKTPCPVCGDIGTFDDENIAKPSRCVR